MIAPPISPITWRTMAGTSTRATTSASTTPIRNSKARVSGR
jgi:hypothetical protein